MAGSDVEAPEPEPEIQRPSLARAIAGGVLKVGLVVGILAYLIQGNSLQFSKLGTLVRDWHWVLLAILFFVPTFLIGAYRYQLLLRSLDMPAGYRTTFSWTMIGAFFDTVAISNGGDFVKAWYVARHMGHGKRGLAVLSALLDRIVGLFALFLFALLACLIAGREVSESPALRGLSFWLTGVCLLGIGGFWVLASERLENSALRRRLFAILPFNRSFERLYTGFAGLRHHGGVLAWILVISMLNHFLCCASILCLAQGLEFTTVADGSPARLEILPSLVVLPLALFLNTFGMAGGFGAGELAFEKLFAIMLNVREGGELAFAFHIMLVAVRFLGLPFVLLYRSQPPAPPAPAASAAADDTSLRSGG